MYVVLSAEPGIATPDSRFTHRDSIRSFSKKVCETGIWRRYSTNIVHVYIKLRKKDFFWNKDPQSHKKSKEGERERGGENTTH
jgi:hypothetical protein